LLNEGEEIVLDLRPHWWFLVGPTAAVVGAILVVIVLFDVHGNIGTYSRYGAGIVALVALAWFAHRYAKWTTTEFVVTTDRIIRRSGIVAKRGREIPLDRLNDISYRQSIFERMIGAGDLMIESAGERGQETFSDMRKPGLVQNEIYHQVEQMKARDAARYSGGPRELSVPEQIEKLDELRQRGVISQAEFDAKKTQLLNRM
jgi:uncharacterized membrane protein YdbT with pleckstrin-like domain